MWDTGSNGTSLEVAIGGIKIRQLQQALAPRYDEITKTTLALWTPQKCNVLWYLLAVDSSSYYRCTVFRKSGNRSTGYQPQWGNNWTPIWRRFPKYKRIMPRFVWLEWKLLEPMSRLPRLPLFPRLPNLSDWNKSSRNDASYQMQRQTYLDIGVNSYFKRYPTAAGYQCHCHAE